MQLVSAILVLATGLVRGDETLGGHPEKTNNFLEFNENSENEIQSFSSPNIDTLQYVLVMTRHGSRTPMYTYPTDPYPYTNRTFWPDGPEELTKFGKQQLFESGLVLRGRYGKFLNVDYRPKDNLVYTNKYNRDFMSAACLLAGLYPPRGYQVWNENLNWQPIPIWEDPFDVAYFYTDKSFCPRFGVESMKAFYELGKINAKYTDLLEYLSSHMGKKIESIAEILNIWDAIHLQEQNGFTLPDWTKEVYPDKLAPLYALVFRISIAGTPLMSRLSAGPLLKKINGHLTDKADGKTHPEERLNINAVHDLTLQAILSALGYEDSFPIETSAFMIFELHKDPEFTVQFLYFNSSAHVVPQILDPPNCRHPCSLEKFNQFVINLSPQDWEAECQVNDEDSNIISNEI